jgi:hypothetical protein
MPRFSLQYIFLIRFEKGTGSVKMLSVIKISSMKKFVFALLFICSFAPLAEAQQAWTSPRGKFYSQIGFTHLIYDGYTEAYDEIVSLNRKITNHSLQGYIQYGLLDKLMVTAIVPVSITASNLTSGVQPIGLSDGKLNQLSNVQTALTYKFYEKKGVVASGKLNFILPTASSNAQTGLRTGDDALGASPSFLVGYGHTKFFTSAELGYVYRTNDYSSQTIANFQIGKPLGKNRKWMGIFHSELRFSGKNGTYNDGNTKYTATYLNDLRYIAYGAKFSYKATSNIMLWSDIRFWSNSTELIGARTDELGLFPGLSFAVSYSN